MKIFGIGLNKTGTSTLHEALTILGYRSFHWGGPAAGALVGRALAAGEPLLSRLEAAEGLIDSISDRVEVSTSFDLADKQYPGSRFVLTVRDIDAWLASRRQHVENNQRRQAAGEYSGTFLTVDLPGWRAQYDTHVARVRAYFGARPDLLELDVTAGGGWAPLCRFLGQDVPSTPFPWTNRTLITPP
jgi:Sulfotransferase domain